MDLSSVATSLNKMLESSNQSEPFLIQEVKLDLDSDLNQNVRPKVYSASVY